MTKAQRFRHHFDARPPGPADCLRTRQAPADCQTCGTALVTIRHTPMRLPGSHCSKCCPVLRGRARAFERIGITRRAREVRPISGLGSAAKSK